MIKNFLRKNVKYTNVVIYAAIILAVNIVGVKLFKHFRLDLTRNKSYTVSKVSEDIVAKLNDPLRIKIFFTRNLPPQYASIERYLRDLMPEYAAKANRYFNYTFYDCTEGKDNTSEKNKANIKIAQDFGVNEVQVQTIEKDEVKLVRAYMGLVIQHGDMIEKMTPIESTEGLEYKITSIIQNMINKISVLQGLKEPVQVKLFLSSDFQQVGPMSGIGGLDSVPEKVKKGVDDSNKRNYGKIQFVHYSDPHDENIKNEARTLNLNGLSWNDFRGPNGQLIKAGVGYAALVVEQGGKSEVMELLEPRMVLGRGGLRQTFSLKNLDKLDERINDLVDGLLDINEEISYLTGKGNTDINKAEDNPFLAQLRQQQSAGGEAANFGDILAGVYTVAQVSINDIDPNIKTLIIAGSQEDFSDYELFQIDQYLMRGRSLVVFHDGVKETQPPFQLRSYQPPTYEVNTCGLEKLLTHYGVDIKGTYVHDEIAYEAPPQRNAFGGMSPKQAIKHAPLITKDQINGDLDILANLKQLIMFKISPLEINKQTLDSNNVVYQEILTSSPEAWELPRLNPFYGNSAPTGEQKKRVLGYILEGRFSSYFADKGLPRQEEEDEAAEEDTAVSRGITGDNSFLKKSTAPGTIVVVGSSEVIKNQLVDSQGRGPNAMFVLNLIDYASGKSDWAVMRSKAQQYNPIEPFDEKASAFIKIFTQRQNLKYFNIFGLPLLVGLFGFFVFYRRKKQKKVVESAFS